MNNLQNNLQKIANMVTDKYKVEKIKICFSDKISKSPAVYKTIKNGNIPCQIVIYNFKEVAKFPSQIVLLLAHELAHHVLNQKKNSLKHSIAHGVLEDEIGAYIYKNLKNLLKNQQKGGKKNEKQRNDWDNLDSKRRAQHRKRALPRCGDYFFL